MSFSASSVYSCGGDMGAAAQVGSGHDDLCLNRTYASCALRMSGNSILEGADERKALSRPSPAAYP